MANKINIRFRLQLKDYLLFFISISLIFCNCFLVSLVTIPIEKSIREIGLGFMNHLINMNDIAVLLLKYIAVWILGHGLYWSSAKISSYALSGLNSKIKLDLFAQVQKAPIDFFKHHGESLVERNIMSYSDGMIDLLNHITTATLSEIMLIFLTLWRVTRFNYKLGLLAILWIVVVAIGGRLYGMYYYNKNKQLIDTRNKQSSFLIDLYKNIVLEKVFQTQAYTYQKFFNVQQQEYQPYREILSMNGMYQLIVGTLNCMFLVFYIWLAASMGYYNELGEICVRAFRLQGEISKLVGSMYSILRSYSRIKASQIFFSSMYEGAIVDSEDGIPLGRLGQIPIDNITVHNLSLIRDKKVIFQHINFIFKKGITLLSGTSGSGKSTLLNVIMGLVKCPRHSVFINDIDINEINRTEIEDKFSVLTQGDIIFDDSVYYNIKMAKPDASDHEFLQACYEAKVSDFMGDHIDNYNRRCGPNGSFFSGGQCKRICIARFLLRDKESNVVVLDEPFAGLSSDIIHYLVELIQRMKKQGRIVIIIDHTGYAREFADEICSMDCKSV